MINLKADFNLAIGGGYPISYYCKKTDTEVIYKKLDNKTAFITFFGAHSFKDYLYAFLGKTKDKFESVWPWIEEQLNNDKIDKVICRAYSQGAATAAYLYRKIYRQIDCDFMFFGAHKTITIPVDNYIYRKDIVGHFPIFNKSQYKNHYMYCPHKWWQFRKIHEYYRIELC